MIIHPPAPAFIPQNKKRRGAGAPPANANLLRVFETVDGGLLLMFDRVVTVDPDNPPTTWAFNHVASIQPGCVNYGASVYLISNGTVDPGNAVVLAANDPAARTPDGGYVNAGMLVVSDL